MANTGIAQGANKGHITTKRNDRKVDSKKKVRGVNSEMVVGLHIARISCSN